MTARPALLLAAALSVASPFRTEEPRVREGNARLRAGVPGDALRLYDEAERAAGPRAEIDLARGHAELSRGDLAAAVAAWRRAAARAPPALASRALQNAGTALAAAGDADGAARALADALARDPSNEDARWNLEVVLRRRAAGERAAPPRDPADAPPSDRGASDARGDGEDRARPAEAPRPPAGPPRGADGPRPPDGSPPDGPDGPQQPAGPPPDATPRAPLSRGEAEALLDALRARERPAPFSPGGAPEGRRPDAAKDW